MTLFFIFKAHYIKRDKECGTFARFLTFSHQGRRNYKITPSVFFSSSTNIV